MYTTVGNLEDANALAKKLVESKLAICVNIFSPHQSIYLEGQTLKEHSEFGLIIKIPEERYAFAYEAVKGWHPYEIPALLSWPAEVNPAYSIWAHNQTAVRF
jgi:periplasmic divalent cation tolerance protein